MLSRTSGRTQTEHETKFTLKPSKTTVLIVEVAISITEIMSVKKPICDKCYNTYKDCAKNIKFDFDHIKYQ